MNRFVITLLLVSTLFVSLQSQNATLPTNAPLPAAIAERDKGLLAKKERQYPLAEKYFRNYQKLSKPGTNAYLEATVLLVEALSYSYKFEEAEKALRDFVSKGMPRNGDKELMSRLNYWFGYIALTRGKHQEAEEIFKQLVNSKISQPLMVKAIYSLSECYFLQKKFKLAQEIYYKLKDYHASTPEAAEAQIELVRLFLMEKQLFWAEREINNLIKDEKFPKRQRIQLFRVILLSYQNKPAEAFKYFSELASKSPLQPDNNWYLCGTILGETLAKAKMYKESAATFEKCLVYATTKEKHEKCMLQLIDSTINLADVAKSITLLKSFQSKYPESLKYVDAAFKLAEMLVNNKSYDEAEKYLGLIIKQEKFSKEQRYQAAMKIGQLRDISGNPLLAHKAYLHAKTLAPQEFHEAQALFLAAEQSLKGGNFKQAAKHFESVAINYKDSKLAEQARFNQGLAYNHAEMYKYAHAAFNNFIKDFPMSTMLADVYFENGVTLQKLNEEIKAANQFKMLFTQAKYEKHKKVLTARLLAAESLTRAGQVNEAKEILKEVINKPGKDPLYPEVYYKLINLNFISGNSENALLLATTFLKTFPAHSLTPDVVLWLGDYYRNANQPEEAGKYYLQLYQGKEKSALAPLAIYEHARLKGEKQPEEALKLLKELETKHPQAPLRIKIQAKLEAGELLNKTGKSADAITAFEGAVTLAKEFKKTYWQIIADGRRADLYVTKAGEDENDALLENAITIYASLLLNKELPMDLKDQVQYKLASCKLKTGFSEDAVELLQDLMYQHEVEHTHGKVRDWKYFTRAAYKLVEIYLASAPALEENLTYEERRMRRNYFNQAIKVLEKLARSKVVGEAISSDAFKRANELRKQLRR